MTPEERAEARRIATQFPTSSTRVLLARALDALDAAEAADHERTETALMSKRGDA